MISLKNIHKSFNDKEILKGIDLTVQDGTTTVIIGPSGSGKSTLLRCINLLETPEIGEVTINQVGYNAAHLKKKDYLDVRQATAFVFQNYGLFANKTILENVSIGLSVVQKKTKQEAHRIAQEALEKVGLYDKKDQYPRQLSGGQQQRVAIARALALHPQVILFDEPTSALDPELVGEVLKVIKDISDEHTTMIIVTHEMEFANQIGDQIVFMEDGQIVEEGSAKDIFETPKKERTKKFLARYRDNYII